MAVLKMQQHYHWVVMAYLLIYLTDTLAGDIEEESLILLEKSEKIATSEVLSSADKAMFKRISAIPFLAFITPVEVMDYKTRKKIKQRTAEIIQDDIDILVSHETTRLQDSKEIHQAALKHIDTQAGRKHDREYHLEKFKRYVLLQKEKTAMTDGGKVISLYEASQIIERWGIDPYDFSAHPYYCALGIYTLDTMNSFNTRLCSLMIQRQKKFEKNNLS